MLEQTSAKVGVTEMSRKKSQRYAVIDSFGARVTQQPEAGGNSYRYVLVCGRCGWESSERKESINPGVVNPALLGRFDCESCGLSQVLSIRESNGTSEKWNQGCKST
jgi:hypothetical protein